MQKNKIIGHKTVNPIGIGTWLIGGDIYRQTNTTYATYGHEKEEIDSLRFSIKSGQNHIDTAQMYSAGHTEEIIGQALEGLSRETLFIASKIWKSHATRPAVPHGIKSMLSRMNIDHLDLVYAHAPFPEIAMEEYMLGLNDAVDQGLTTYIGVSNFNLEQLQAAIKISKHPISAIQNHYNLLHKAEFPEELKTFCLEKKIAMVAYRPLGRKMLADECTNETLLAMAQKYNKTTAQIALNWLISQNGMHCIPKALQKQNITENLGALDFEMTEADLTILSSLPDEPQK